MGFSMKLSTQKIEAGYAPYTKGLLSIYDAYVIGFSARYLWRCHSGHILDLYNQNVSANHLDVGIGTGHFLDLCAFPSVHSRLALMDANPNCLEWAQNRLGRYNPEIYEHNLFDKPNADIKPFDSIGLNYVLHCLPESMSDKAVVLQNLNNLLKPGGVLFGSTILADARLTNPISRAFMRLYNRMGVFSNLHDTQKSLEQILKANFAQYSIKVIGCVAIFKAENFISLKA
jgi:SAM-dependent methyltransferase